MAAAEWLAYQALLGLGYVMVMMTPAWFIYSLKPRWLGSAFAVGIALLIGRFGPTVLGRDWFEAGYFTGMITGACAGYAEARVTPESEKAAES